MPDSSFNLDSAISDVAKTLPQRAADVSTARVKATDATDAATESLGARARGAVDLAGALSKSKPPELSEYTKGLQEPSAPPSAEQGNPFQNLFSLAIPLAFFGGKLTRTPLTTGFKAAASAMNAKRKGDLQAYQMAVQDWETQAQHANSLMKWRMDAYNAALNKHKGDTDQLMAEWKLIGEATNDTLMQQTLRTGDLAAAEKVYNDQLGTLTQYQTHLDSVRLQNERLEETRKYHEAMINKPTAATGADPITKLWTTFKQNNPEGTWADFEQSYRNLKGTLSQDEKFELERTKQTAITGRSEISANAPDAITKLWNTYRQTNPNASWDEFEKSYRNLHGTMNADEKTALEKLKQDAQTERSADPITKLSKTFFDQNPGASWQDFEQSYRNLHGTLSAEEKKSMEAAKEENKIELEKLKEESKKVPVESIDKLATMIANYEIAPLPGNAMRTTFGLATMARVSEINPDYQSSLFAQRNKAVKDFGTGPQGNAIRSFNVALSHLDTLQSLADALKNNDTQGVNRLANKVAEETGAPAPTKFDAAKQIVGQEIVKSIVASGGGVTERQEAAERISSANSPAQLAGVIRTYKELMAGQLKGLRQQYENTTGLKNFDERLSDEAKKTLKDLEGATPSLPAEARALLSKGVIRTFGNGQRWTLDDNGNAVQVP